MSDSEVCRLCGGSGVVTPPPGGEAAFSERIRTASDQDRTASDQDQTASDQDQTWSDHNQTASDRDQRSADDDQSAADADFVAGGDSVVHEQTKVARERASRDRDDVAHMRDETAAGRLETAAHRDRSAELRDHLPESRDPLARRGAQPDSDTGVKELVLRAERDRSIAAADRARAADDRAEAAADRELATRQREEAFLAQAEAQRDLLAAATDELTGAFNRKVGLANISREIERARRTDDSLTLAMIDVDGLKEVNDTHGQWNGDELLCRVVDTVRANVRGYDVIVRYGGDEFLCALPHLTRDVASDRMQKIAALLTAADEQHSIGFGVAEYDPGETVDALIERADAALLAAKRSHKRHEAA